MSLLINNRVKQPSMVRVESVGVPTQARKAVWNSFGARAHFVSYLTEREKGAFRRVAKGCGAKTLQESHALPFVVIALPDPQEQRKAWNIDNLALSIFSFLSLEWQMVPNHSSGPHCVGHYIKIHEIFSVFRACKQFSFLQDRFFKEGFLAELALGDTLYGISERLLSISSLRGIEKIRIGQYTHLNQSWEMIKQKQFPKIRILKLTSIQFDATLCLFLEKHRTLKKMQLNRSLIKVQKSFENIAELELDDCQFNGQFLEANTHLQVLRLEGCMLVGDRVFASIEKMVDLTTLELGEVEEASQLTDQTVRAIAQFPRLTHLKIWMQRKHCPCDLGLLEGSQSLQVVTVAADLINSEQLVRWSAISTLKTVKILLGDEVIDEDEFKKNVILLFSQKRPDVQVLFGDIRFD